ncbi:hypothetical protein [Azotobacter salinestris]|uniref:hypothetical protein n=1 Tax=Azotobacter salinestris TaxID=69964 RepID=UPI00142F14F8|nr:hypothetical protein [Azotobacter salinestris]
MLAFLAFGFPGLVRRKAGDGFGLELPLAEEGLVHPTGHTDALAHLDLLAALLVQRVFA